MKEKEVKCEFCKKRIVKQQDWKTDIEKKYCLTCRSFIEYLINLEKALRNEMEALGIEKDLRIEIRKRTSEEKLLRAIGKSDDVDNLE